MRKMAEPWNVALTFEWVQKNLWDPDRSPRGVQGFRDDTPVEVTTEADEADNDVGNNDEK
jgi:hypothetical protein